MQSQRAIFNFFASSWLWLALAGCQGQSQITAAPPPACPAPATPAAGTTLALADAVPSATPRQILFYQDLLPVLSAQTGTRIYKCTTCHADYAKPEGMNSVTEVNRVIDAMQTKYMPRGGTFVTDAEIQLFRDWQLQGFKPGDPSAPASPQPTTGSSDALGAQPQVTDPSATAPVKTGCAG